jgi:hypothetical protein
MIKKYNLIFLSLSKDETVRNKKKNGKIQGLCVSYYGVGGGVHER